MYVLLVLMEVNVVAAVLTAFLTEVRSAIKSALHDPTVAVASLQ